MVVVLLLLLPTELLVIPKESKRLTIYIFFQRFFPRACFCLFLATDLIQGGRDALHEPDLTDLRLPLDRHGGQRVVMATTTLHFRWRQLPGGACARASSQNAAP